jgi:NAD(P)-dependent dehydrogenase (short-subunit alcohol dehydrogenase family)
VRNPLKVSVLPVSISPYHIYPTSIVTWSEERKLTTAPIGRAGQPIEVATPFVFLASADSSYFTAQVSPFFRIHV